MPHCRGLVCKTWLAESRTNTLLVKPSRSRTRPAESNSVRMASGRPKLQLELGLGLGLGLGAEFRTEARARSSGTRWVIHLECLNCGFIRLIGVFGSMRTQSIGEFVMLMCERWPRTVMGEMGEGVVHSNVATGVVVVEEVVEEVESCIAYRISLVEAIAD